LVVNKSDLGGKEIPDYRQHVREQIQRNFHFFDDVKVVFTSAKNMSGIKELLDTVEEVSDLLKLKIPTSDLNDFFFETIRKAPAPVWANNNVKFYYLTQTMQVPPSFIAFANHPDGVDKAYRRFLSKRIKERWGLEGLPIRIFVMKSSG